MVSPICSLEIENLYEYIKSEVDAPMTTLMEESDKAASDLSQEFYKWQAFFTKKVSPRIEKHTTTIAETLSRATT